MSRSRWIKLLVFIGLLLLAGTLYIKMNGLKKPDIAQAKAPTYYLAGTAYKGSAKVEAFGKLFAKMDEVAARDTNLTVAAIYTVAPTEGNDFYLEAIVGVLLPDSAYALPSGLTAYTWPAQDVIRGKISGSYLLQGRLYEQIADYASEKGLTIDPNQSFERYEGKEDVTIEVPLLPTTGPSAPAK